MKTNSEMVSFEHRENQIDSMSLGRTHGDRRHRFIGTPCLGGAYQQDLTFRRDSAGLFVEPLVVVQVHPPDQMREKTSRTMTASEALSIIMLITGDQVWLGQVRGPAQIFHDYGGVKRNSRTKSRPRGAVHTMEFFERFPPVTRAQSDRLVDIVLQENAFSEVRTPPLHPYPIYFLHKKP